MNTDNINSREGLASKFKKMRESAKPTIGNTKLSSDAYKKANALTHLYRAGSFAKNGALVTDDLLTNSGVITKHQMKAGRISRFMTAGAGVFTAYSLLEDGPETAATNIAGFTAGSYGYRVGKELGHAGLKSVGIRGMASVAGGIAAGLTGFAAGATIAAGIISIGNSDNFIKTIDSQTGKPNLINEVAHSRGTLTQRQKMLNKLSKSGLNDRGQLLGNEALIIRGVL